MQAMPTTHILVIPLHDTAAAQVYSNESILAQMRIVPFLIDADGDPGAPRMALSQTLADPAAPSDFAIAGVLFLRRSIVSAETAPTQDQPKDQ